ncbi:MAG TPA: ABATE domain-containing protein [Gemmatimonadales bacterium]|nr:ABATE domain-containing protein [Gemmatimonadales bacterium]
MSAPAAAPPARLPLRFVGGDPALDLVNTVDWTPRGQVDERLDDYGRLAEWAHGAGLASRREAAALAARAAARPGEASAALLLAREARQAIRRAVAARARGAASSADLAELNRLLGEALPHLRLARGGDGLELAWQDAESHLESPVWGAVWSAAKLLASDEADRIRMCAGPDCGWMYVDRSRNGLRRWCEMATCGTREKSRRRREG